MAILAMWSGDTPSITHEPQESFGKTWPLSNSLHQSPPPSPPPILPGAATTVPRRVTQELTITRHANERRAASAPGVGTFSRRGQEQSKVPSPKSKVARNRYFLIEMTEADPDGAGSQTSPVWTYAVDAAGQVTSATDPLGRLTSYTYGTPGWVTKVTRPDPDGAGGVAAPEWDYTYDGNWNVTSVTDPLDRVTTYEYDVLDRLKKITRPDPDGGGPAGQPITTYAYDASGNLTSVTDPLNRVTAYAYDGLNRRTTVTQPDPDGAGSLTSPVTTFTYDKVGNVVSITDPRGNVTTRALDDLYRQITVTQADPDGAGSLTSPVTSFTYDAAGQLLSVTDPMSRVTNYEYNGLGLNTKIIEPDPDGVGSATRPETVYAYDAMRNLLSVTDPLSHTTEYAYDNLYRQTRITDANDGETDFTYDLVGNLLTLTDPVENTTTWTYDPLDRVTEEENELGHSRLFEYDLADRLLEKTDRNGRVTEYDYDGLDRLTTETWIDVPSTAPTLSVSTTTQGDTTDEVQRVGMSVSGMGFSGGTFTLTYDGQTTSGIAYNASAATVQSALEALSTIAPGDISVTKSGDSQWAQVWDVSFTGPLAETNVNQITIDSSGVTVMGTKFDTQSTLTQGGQITYEVQAATINNANDGTFTLSLGGQTSQPIAWNATSAAVDTALEALTTIDTVTVSGNAGGPWSITFTGEHSGENVPQMTGNGANLENHQNRVLSFEYDAADQLTEASDPAAAYAYVYDNLGRVTSETIDLAGLTPDVVFAKTYDAAGNRLSVAATVGANADFKNEYVYDGLNRMTQVIQQGNGGNTVAVKRVDFTYNAAGQFDVISRFQSTDTSAPVATSHYGYDGIGRLTSLDHKTNGGGTTLAGYDYTFDAASRITSVDSLIDGLTSFTYDVTDQLTAADHATQPDETYSFDLNGNRTMTGYSIGDNNRLLSDGTYNYTYDNEGNRTARENISSGARTEYEWDHRNRLTKVTEKNSGGTVLKTTENTYDVFDHWIRRSYDADGAGAGTAVDTFFLYDGTQIVLEFDGADDEDLSHRYLWGNEVDQFFSDEQLTSLSSEGNTLWGLGDHLGTLRDIADRNESTGVTTVTNHRDYEAFGTRLSETNSAVDLLFGFTSRLLDETTGLQDNWHRPYDSKTGNWPSEDPIGFGGLDTNLTRYVLNTPALLIDPEGLTPPIPPVGEPPWAMGDLPIPPQKRTLPPGADPSLTQEEAAEFWHDLDFYLNYITQTVANRLIGKGLSAKLLRTYIDGKCDKYVISAEEFAGAVEKYDLEQLVQIAVDALLAEMKNQINGSALPLPGGAKANRDGSVEFRDFRFRFGDLSTAIGGVHSIRAELDGGGIESEGFHKVLKARLRITIKDRYDFHKIKANANLPGIGSHCRFAKGDFVSDQDLASLEDWGYAKSFDVETTLEIEITVVLNRWTMRRIGEVEAGPIETPKSK